MGARQPQDGDRHPRGGEEPHRHWLRLVPCAWRPASAMERKSEVRPGQGTAWRSACGSCLRASSIGSVLEGADAKARGWLTRAEEPDPCGQRNRDGPFEVILADFWEQEPGLAMEYAGEFARQPRCRKNETMQECRLEDGLSLPGDPLLPSIHGRSFSPSSLTTT